MENLRTLNSLVRTLLATVLVGGAGTAGWYGYQVYRGADRELESVQRSLADREATLARTRQDLDTTRQQLAARDEELAEQRRQIDQMTEELLQKQQEIARLDTALRLHKMERRLAQLSVLDVETDPESGQTFSTIGFLEMNDAGEPVGPMREFQLEGDVVYVDYRVVKFDDAYVEQADLERGTTICLFNRIFGEYQRPSEGFTLDEPGSRPGSYARGGAVSEFEQKIWDDFWTIANDPQRAEQLGIRALHGDAVSIKVQAGNSYRITVRASGGPEIQVDQDSSSQGAATISNSPSTPRPG